MSASRSVPENRAATACSNLSPMACPSVSLMSLRPSRSMNSTRHVGVFAPRFRQLLTDAIEDQDPVGEAGQAVVEGPMTDLAEKAAVADGDGRLAAQRP